MDNFNIEYECDFCGKKEQASSYDFDKNKKLKKKFKLIHYPLPTGSGTSFCLKCINDMQSVLDSGTIDYNSISDKEKCLALHIKSKELWNERVNLQVKKHCIRKMFFDMGKNHDYKHDLNNNGNSSYDGIEHEIIFEGKKIESERIKL